MTCACTFCTCEILENDRYEFDGKTYCEEKCARECADSCVCTRCSTS